MDAKPRARTLEITVISGENICLDRNPVAENVYVVVRPESIDCYTTKMAKVGDGGNLLAWNEKFLLDIPMHARSVTFEVQCKKYKGVRPIGVARIAISDFLGGSAVPENCLQMFSYGLRDWDGRRNGVIHFSVRVATSCSEIKPAKGIMAVSSCGSEHQVMGFQVMNKKNSNDVVIGIPVLWTSKI